MNCDDACRCYADDTFGNPREDQMCGVKRRGYILPCRSDCCHGGCPGTHPKEPYGYGKYIDIRMYIRAVLTLFAIAIVLIYLKVWGL